MIKYIILSVFYLISSFLYAKPVCSLLWFNTATQTSFINIELNGHASGVYPLQLSVGGPSTAIYSYSEDMYEYQPVYGSYRYWIQYDEAWQRNSAGISFRVRSSLEPAIYQTIDRRTVMSPIKYHTWNVFGCPEMNSSYNFEQDVLEGFQVEILAPELLPGDYTLNVPIKVAYEENKGLDNTGWPKFSFLMSMQKEVNSNIQLHVKPQCTLLSDSLSVNMGDSITPLEAQVGVQKKIDISINCNYPARVKWNLTGSAVQEGVHNRTTCGTGYCELFFHNGKGEMQTDSPQGLSTQDIYVRYIDADAKEGVFSGSAVLSVEVV